jgi:hypothetical protein
MLPTGSGAHMSTRPIGVVLLAGALLAASLVGVAAFVAVLPRSAGTSPLAALFALLWAGTYFASATLTWRRSRLAPLAFVAAVALLLFPASFIVPGGQLFLPSAVVIGLVAALGSWYLRTASRPTGIG